MSDRQLTDAELGEIEAATASGNLRQHERLEEWVRRLTAELRDARSRAAPERADATGAPHKAHGDALLDRSRSRHGADAEPG